LVRSGQVRKWGIKAALNRQRAAFFILGIVLKLNIIIIENKNYESIEI
jgi:hypothetical protein